MNGRANYSYIVRKSVTMKERRRRCSCRELPTNKHFSEDGRKVEITVDIVLMAKAHIAESKVNGPEDTVVAEMIHRLLAQKVYSIQTHVQDRFMGRSRAPASYCAAGLEQT